MSARSPSGDSAALRIFTAGATREGLGMLADRFRTKTGFGLDIDTKHGHLVRDSILAGEAETDVVSLPVHMIETLADADLISSDPGPVTIGAIRVGAAARTGQPLPDVSDMEALRRTLRKARSIVLTEAPSGQHMERVIDDLGVRREVDDRIVRYDTGTMVNEHLVASTTLREVAFGVATEILFARDKGVSYAGPLPEEVQMTHTYRVALLAGSDRSDAARILFDFLETEESRAAFAETGVEPD